MTAEEIRKKFLEFFEKRGHKIIPSASLIPENDPTVLFTTAGMQPLIPYFLGEKHPGGKRLVNIQKCVRTGDIDEVGDTSHLTFFEMLGYWSLGDYFKKESIHYTFEFYTKVLGFNKDDISITVFAGDESADFDEESFNVWKDEIGIPEERIYHYSKKENWWGPVGETGPCGPCTEMFIDTKKPKCNENCGPSCTCGKFVEIGNNVFIAYSKKSDGTFEELPQKNVDVGLGFERLVMFSQNKESIYETDLFLLIIEKIEELSGKKYEENVKEFRIIADHVRSAVFIINDGIIPSNTEAGYVLRRLIRRAIRYANVLKIKNIDELVDPIIKIHKDIYENLSENCEKIRKEIKLEEDRFKKTLDLGLKEFKKGIDPFVLATTYGFPIELTEELAKEKGIKIDLEDFKKKMKEHQELSRTASAGMFKGGLGGVGEMETKLHTVTHLLNQALRQVLGNHVMQKGSNITAERLRFDFTHNSKMTEEQKKEVEEIVNQKIAEKLLVVCEEMPIQEAEKVAIHSFNEKYGDIVKVYKIGDFSAEFCGGPHVSNTSELGKLKIQKEEAVAQGVRRIKAVLE